MRGDDTSDPSADRPWSEMDLFDLANCVRLKQPAEEIADFLCRPVSEVCDKIAALERSGVMDRRVAEAPAGAED